MNQSSLRLPKRCHLFLATLEVKFVISSISACTRLSYTASGVWNTIKRSSEISQYLHAEGPELAAIDVKNLLLGSCR